MPKLLRRRQIITFKIESTYNTDSVPTPAADSVLVEGLTWSNTGLKMVERPAIRPSLGMLQSIFGGRMVQVSFTVEVKGSGALGVAPEIGQLLRACKVGETIVGGVSVTYGPVSSLAESGSMYLYEDGKRIRITGMRGNVSCAYAAGATVKYAFVMQGHVTPQTDLALPTPTYDTTKPVPFIAGAFTVDGFSAVISTFNFDLGNTVATPESVNGADGYDETEITARNVTGSINPLDELIVDEDFIGNFTSGKLMALTTGPIGTVAGNILTTTLPAIYYMDANSEDRDGFNAFALPFGAAEVATDDEFSLAFT